MMRVIASALVFALAAAEAAGQGAAAGLNGYVTVATGYWNRGLSQHDGGLALQAGADYQHRSGLFAGGGLADVDYASADARGEPRELEASAYVGYHRRNTVWSWTATLGRYFYPDDGGSYDYSEVGASVGFRDRLFFSTSYTDDFFSLDRPAWNSELAMTFPLARNFELSAALGRFDLDITSSTEFTHWNVGVSKVARRVAFDLRYYRSRYALATQLGDPGSDRYVLSVTYALRGARPRI
jgi:uncharacterized protein (TIGR02001 family)